MPIFNTDRTYEDGQKPSYPLFLGEPLSLNDGVDVQYPELEELILKQRSQMWHEKTVSMNADRVQFPNLPKNIQDISILNLAWQSQADSIAGRAPIQALAPFVSNPQLEELLIMWQYFEQIHSRAYQHIIKSVFPEPAKIRNEVARLEESMDRLQVVTAEFEKLENMGALYTISQNGQTGVSGFDLDCPKQRKEVLTQICKSVVSLYGMESIQFIVSFACTFALANQDVLTGTSDQVRKIAKDELLHIKFSLAILNILAREPETSELYEQCLKEMQAVLDSIVEAEKKWARFLFSEGRVIVGMNAELAIEYLDHLATLAYREIGLEYHTPVEENPIPWIETYLHPEKVQVAPQERDNTNYTIGSVVNDLSEVNDKDNEFLGFSESDFEVE